MSATHPQSSWPGLTRPPSALASASASIFLRRADARLLDGRLKGGHDGRSGGRAGLPLLAFAAAAQHQRVVPNCLPVSDVPPGGRGVGQESRNNYIAEEPVSPWNHKERRND